MWVPGASLRSLLFLMASHLQCQELDLIFFFFTPWWNIVDLGCPVPSWAVGALGSAHSLCSGSVVPG